MKIPNRNENFKYVKIKLPSGKSIGVRGWKVKDERELLFSLDTEENPQETKIMHIMDFLGECTDNKSVYSGLSETDRKKVAIEIRKLSKGNSISYNYKCDKVLKREDGTERVCGELIDDVLMLSKAEVIKPFDVSPSEIDENIFISFKDISYVKSLELYEKYKESPSKYTFYYIVNSIEAITQDGVSYTEFSEEEIEEWLDNLDPNVMEKIYSEFNTKASSIELKHSTRCLRCGSMVDVNFGDFISFLIF